jgi:antirestriction protein
MTMCRLYVASLSDYNAGILHGEWIDVTDEGAMREGISAMLASSPTAKQEGLPAEEWAIHDYEGFGELRLSEYEGTRTSKPSPA